MIRYTSRHFFVLKSAVLLRLPWLSQCFFPCCALYMNANAQAIILLSFFCFAIKILFTTIHFVFRDFVVLALFFARRSRASEEETTAATENNKVFSFSKSFDPLVFRCEENNNSSRILSNELIFLAKSHHFNSLTMFGCHYIVYSISVAIEVCGLYVFASFCVIITDFFVCLLHISTTADIENSFWVGLCVVFPRESWQVNGVQCLKNWRKKFVRLFVSNFCFLFRMVFMCLFTWTSVCARSLVAVMKHLARTTHADWKIIIRYKIRYLFAFYFSEKKWHHTLVAARSKRRPVLLQYLQFLWVFRCVNFEICIDSLFGEEEKTKLANCIPFRLSNSWCSVKFNFACAQPVSTPGENAYSTFLLSVTPRNSQRQRVLRLNMRCLTETQYLFQFRADPMKRKILNIYNDNEHSTHYLYKLSVIVRLPYDRFFRVTAKIKQK